MIEEDLKPAGHYRDMRPHARQSTRTQGRGTIKRAIQPNSVFPHLYVNVANICCVNSGNAIPSRLPQKIASDSSLTGQFRVKLTK